MILFYFIFFCQFKPLSFYLSDSLTSETVCSSEGIMKGKHRKDEELEEDEEEDEEVENRHNAKRLKIDKDAEEENEASGKEFSCHAPVESSTDVSESSPHVSLEVKDTSALTSEDQGKLFLQVKKNSVLNANKSTIFVTFFFCRCLICSQSAF